MSPDLTAAEDGSITHVSDTALMVAACRAFETENVARFGLAVRTVFIDELLCEALAAHAITTVLSVGCGLDTRLVQAGGS